MTIGIFSGTFDPIHEGHILFANVCIEQFGLDEVVFIPEPEPRRKQGVTRIDNRVEMLDLALKPYTQLTLLQGLAPQHTLADTLQEVINYAPDSDYVIMLGSDAFDYVPAWEGIEELASSLGFIVGIRADDNRQNLEFSAEKHGYDAEFVLVPLPNASSSKIRLAIEEGKQAFAVPEEIEDYIKANKLYS